MRLLPLGSRPVAGSVRLTQVVFGLLSREQVQAEEKAPQNHGGRRPHGGTLQRAAKPTAAGHQRREECPESAQTLAGVSSRGNNEGSENHSRSCQLGSSCMLEHVRLQQRRSRRWCVLTSSSLASSDGGQRAGPVAGGGGPQSCCWVSLLHSSGSGPFVSAEVKTRAPLCNCCTFFQANLKATLFSSNVQKPQILSRGLPSNLHF